MEFQLKNIILLANELFNIQNLLPVQTFVIFNILDASDTDNIEQNKRNQLVILPTGTGKTLCFQIPILLLPHPSLIVYPLHSLIHDQYRRFIPNIATEILIGGMTKQARDRVFENLRSGKTKCVLTNPETLQKYSENLAKQHFSLIVLDEAHCISKWGRNFRPSYKELGPTLAKLNYGCCVGFTATASEEVIQDIRSLAFRDEDVYVLRGDADRNNISYSVLYCAHKDIALAQLLRRGVAGCARSSGESAGCGGESTRSGGESGGKKIVGGKDREDPKLLPSQCNMDPVERPAIVFCNTRNECRRLALELSRQSEDESMAQGAGVDEVQDMDAGVVQGAGVDETQDAGAAQGAGAAKGEDKIFFYHAGLSKDEKKQVEESFFQSSDAILFATCAYGMGVDKSDIRTVIHVNKFRDIESYLQESGRGGRDRKPAKAIQLCEFDNMAYRILEHNYSSSTLERDRKDGTLESTSELEHEIEGDLQKQADAPSQDIFAGYQLSLQCRREFLLKQLQSSCENCSGCDICSGSPITVSPELPLLLRYIDRNQGLCTIDFFIQNKLNYIYRDKKQEASLQYLVFQALSSWTTPQVHSVFQSLISLRFLFIGRFFWKRRLFLSKKGKRLLSLLEKASRPRA